MPGDPNKYLYGGDPNAAGNEAGRLNEQGRQGQFRQGEQINTANADAARQQGQGARAGQVDMASMLRQRAMGQTPSIAGMRANQDMRRVAAEQTSAAAGARGPAALALAQQGAAANTAGAQSAISNSAQINSAQERQQAEQAAFAAQSQIRAGDQSQQGQDFGQSAAQSQLNAAQRAQNDQYQLANQGQAQGVQGMQLGANMNQDAADRSDYWNQVGLEHQKNQERTSTLMGIAGMGASVAGAVGTMSDENAKVPVRFGSPGISPGGVEYGASARDDAPGYDPNSVTMAKMIAHRALDEQTQRETAAHTQDQLTGGGPMAYDGVEALKRRDSEDLGLMRSKERNGLELSDREQASKGALAHRVGAEKPAQAEKARAAVGKEVAATEKPGAGAGVANSLQGVGKALTGMSETVRPREAWKPTQAQHYAMPTPYQAPVTWSDERTKKPAGKMSMAELLKAARAMQEGTDAQRTTLREGPATDASARRLEGEGRDIADRTEAQRAMLDAGPAIDPSKTRTTSDDHAKVALAQREAFSAGLAHANQAADTGSFGEVPAYMKDAPSTEKRNTPGERRAAAMTESRKDRTAQSAANKRAGWELAKADMVSMPGMGGTLNGAGAIRRGEIADEQQERANATKRTRPTHVDPTSFTRENPAPVGDPERTRVQPPQADRRVGNAVYERESPDTRPDYQKFANQVLFGRSSADGPVSMSDERTKVGHLGLEMSHSDMAEAARSMRAVPYAYKPEFAGQERQAPGEVNVGPVAQEMQKSPVAATAVKQDSPDGLRSIDLPKFTKVLGGIVASQQEEIDDLKKSRGSFMARRVGGKR